MNNYKSFRNKALSAALALSLLGTTAMATEKVNADGGAPSISVTSHVAGSVTFLVAVPNAEKSDLQVVIRDHEGNVLYREFVKDANYAKAFEVRTADVDKVKFEVFKSRKLVLDNTYRLDKKVEEKLDVQLVSAK
jgi:hypothetical protein